MKITRRFYGLISGVVPGAVLIAFLAGCTSTIVGEYDYNDYHYTPPKRTFVADAKILEKVSSKTATYTLSGNFYLPMPKVSDKKVLEEEKFAPNNPDYRVFCDLVSDPCWAGITTVCVIGPIGALINKEFRSIYFSFFCPGISVWVGADGAFQDPEPFFYRKIQTRTVPKTGRTPLPAKKPTKKEVVGFQLLDEVERLHKQTKDSTSLSLDLEDLAKRALKEGKDTFTVIARIGKAGDTIIGGQTEFVFSHRALDYSVPYNTLTDIITADCEVEIYTGSHPSSLKKSGTAPWEKKLGGFGKKLKLRYVQVRGENISSSVIKQPPSTKNRSIHFVTQTRSITLNCAVENALLKCGSTLEQLKVSGPFPRQLSEKMLVPSTGGRDSESSEYWVQAIADGYYSEPFKVDFSATEQITFVEKSIWETITSDPPGANILLGEKSSLMESLNAKTPYKQAIKALVANVSGKQQKIKFPAKYVSLQLPGYFSTVGSLPRSESDRSIHFETKMITEKVLSVPSGADVLMGNSKETLQKLGTTPYEGVLKALIPENSFGFMFPGKLLAVWKSRHERKYVEWPETSGNRVANFELKKVPVGYLRLHADGAGVRVFVDGEFYDEIECADKALVLLVPAGKHIIHAEKDFYRTESLSIHLAPDDIREHKFELKNVEVKNSGMTTSTLVQGKGLLRLIGPAEFTATVVGGTIRTVLELPGVIPEIPAGTYSIQIEGPNFDKTLMKTIKDGEPCTINLEDYGITF